MCPRVIGQRNEQTFENRVQNVNSVQGFDKMEFITYHLRKTNKHSSKCTMLTLGECIPVEFRHKTFIDLHRYSHIQIFMENVSAAVSSVVHFSILS